MLNSYFPLCTITLTDRDPSCITPQVKQLLRQKNRLLHQNKTGEADALTIRIRVIIARFNDTTLTNIITNKYRIYVR